jgi:hypothetical protein
MTIVADDATGVIAANLITDFADRQAAAIAAVVADPAPVLDPAAFSPGFRLPDLDNAMNEFYAAATAGWQEIGTYEGHRLVLLDLTRNPGTHTTKTYASLLIVARAVEYIRSTGQPIVIFSPTSANKGTALRDAVLRAIDTGLAGPEQLRVVTLAPAGCLPKLRASRLSTDPQLRALNPLLLYPGDEAEQVKPLGRAFATQYGPELVRRTGANLWYSLDLANYLVADTARAFFEHEDDPSAAPRVHAHAVSSAFGLLGYHRGRQVLEDAGDASPATRPASLLVQHLGTPDMVLHLRHHDFDRARVPAYTKDTGSGLYRQDADPRFPATTYDPAEVLDPTFYTHRPATSPAMDEIIEAYGGDGIVVSLHECLQLYPWVRERVDQADRPLPADPRTVREWSVVMALTGVCTAIDRGLVPAGRDIVVHGSGWYATSDYTPPRPDHAVLVSTVEDIASAVLGPQH